VGSDFLERVGHRHRARRDLLAGRTIAQFDQAAVPCLSKRAEQIAGTVARCEAQWRAENPGQEPTRKDRLGIEKRAWSGAAGCSGVFEHGRNLPNQGRSGFGSIEQGRGACGSAAGRTRCAARRLKTR